MWRGHAFGVELEAEEAVDVAIPGPGAGRTPVVPVTTHAAAELDAAWPSAGTRRLVDQRRPDGTPFLVVDEHPEAGWRIEAPGHGTHLVAADGGSLRSSDDALAPSGRHLLLAQALPTLAAAHGFTCLHAAGVVVAGRAVALVGPSGVGKSTVSAALVAAGASFLADDVVAVAYGAGVAWAQPGTRTRRSVVSGEEKDLRLVDDPVGEAPLGAVVWLDRADAGDPLVLDDLPPDAARLLGTTSLPHLDAPAVLMGALDVAAHLAEEAACVRLRVPEGADSARTAEALLGALA